MSERAKRKNVMPDKKKKIMLSELLYFILFFRFHIFLDLLSAVFYSTF